MDYQPDEEIAVQRNLSRVQFKNKEVDVSLGDSRWTCRMPERMAAGDIPDKLFGCDFTSVSDILIFERHPFSVSDDIGRFGNDFDKSGELLAKEQESSHPLRTSVYGTLEDFQRHEGATSYSCFIDDFVLTIMMVAFFAEIYVGSQIEVLVTVYPECGFYTSLFTTVIPLVISHISICFHRKTQEPVLYKDKANVLYRFYGIGTSIPAASGDISDPAPYVIQLSYYTFGLIMLMRRNK